MHRLVRKGQSGGAGPCLPRPQAAFREGRRALVLCSVLLACLLSDSGGLSGSHGTSKLSLKIRTSPVQRL